MNTIYNKELTDIWSAKAMELGLLIGEFTVDGIEFASEEEVEFANGSYWNTLTVWADGKEIYQEETEVEECDVEETA
jgi:hypothetical protein